MGNRRYEMLKEKYPWVRYGMIWNGRGIGRYWKRQLSKARRRHIKAILMGQEHPRIPKRYESECNWKNT